MLTAVQNTKYAFSRSMGPRNVRKQVEILSTIYYFFLQIEGLALYRVENFTTIIVEINGDLKSKSKCFRSGIFKIVVLQTSQTSDNSESSQELTVFFFLFPNSFLDSRIVNLGVVRLWYKNEFLQSLGFAALKTLNGNCVFDRFGCHYSLSSTIYR